MTTTVNYSWALPTVGASVNTWGTLLNAVLTDIDAKMFARTGGTISGNVSIVGGTLEADGAAWLKNASLKVGNSSGVGNNGAKVIINGWNTAGANWQIDTAVLSGVNELAFTPSTTAGGMTFTTPVMKLSTTGLAVTGLTKTTTYFSANDQGYIRGDRAGYLQFQGGTSGYVWTNNGNNTDQMTLDASGNLQVMGPRLSIGDAGYVVLAPGGNVVLNLESLSGLATAGLLLVRGNENGLNQSIAVYSYNLSFDGGSTRYCRIIQMHRNVLNNTYGDVYAYLSNYAGSYTTADQSYSSNATSMSDIYMRNAAGAAGSANYAIIRLV